MKIAQVHTGFCGFFLILMALIVQLPAYAEIVRGKVSAVNADVQFLLISASNPGSQANQPVRIQIREEPDTVFDGLRGLDELNEGDEVLVDAIADRRGPWAARKIRLEKIPAQAALPK